MHRALPLLIVIALASVARAQPPLIEVSPRLADKLASGLAVRLELHIGDAPAGTCTITYDLWTSRFRIQHPRSIAGADTTLAAIEACVDRATVDMMRRVARVAWLPAPAPIVAREIENQLGLGSALGIDRRSSEVWCGVSEAARYGRQR